MKDKRKIFMKEFIEFKEIYEEALMNKYSECTIKDEVVLKFFKEFKKTSQNNRNRK